MVKEFIEEELKGVTGGAQVASYSRFDKNDVFKDNRFTNRYIVIKDTVDIPADKQNVYLLQYYEGVKKNDGKVHVTDMKVYGATHNLIVNNYTLANLEVAFG